MLQDMATITSKRQLTIPAKIFRKLGLKEGEKVKVMEEDGSLKMQVTADKDCDGIPESVEWSIPKESYISLLEPTLR